jgi:hypothetical protein
MPIAKPALFRERLLVVSNQSSSFFTAISTPASATSRGRNRRTAPLGYYPVPFRIGCRQTFPLAVALPAKHSHTETLTPLTQPKRNCSNISGSDTCSGRRDHNNLAHVQAPGVQLRVGGHQSTHFYAILSSNPDCRVAALDNVRSLAGYGGDR